MISDKTLSSLVLLITTLLTISLLPIAEAADTGSWQVPKSSIEAAELALKYTGFKTDSDSVLTADEAIVGVVDVRDSITPFISEQIDGRRAWVVRLSNVILSTRHTIPEIAWESPKDFNVYIDSVTGELLGIRAEFHGKNPDLLPPPVSSHASPQLERAHEKYYGIPESPPSSNLFAVLDGLKRAAAVSNEIYVNYVIFSGFRQDPVPAWTIQLRGHPRDSRHANMIDPCYRNYWRFVVRDSDGVTVSSSNAPHPVPREEGSGGVGGGMRVIE